MSSMPLLTVGTLSYNTGKYVVEALECVKKQGYPNVQHIIIDDCSIDNSVGLITEWININNYSCTFIKHDINRGVQYGLKEIFDLAKGKYIAFISDDLWLDNGFLNLVNMFNQLDESYALVYGDTQMIDKDRRILKASLFERDRGKDFIPPSGDIFKEVVKGFYFWTQASIISVSHFKKLNFAFDAEIISEDWDWQLGLSRNFNIKGVKDVYGSYRYLDTSIGRTTWTEAKIYKVWKSQARMFLNYYNHPKNTKEEKKMIFQQVWHLYKSLARRSDFTKSDRKEFLDNMFNVTHRYELLIVKYSLIIMAFERYVWKLLRLK
jgi:glycosyltransferase involved in cell wall biosynthesis